jgi:hypothetical protein
MTLSKDCRNVEVDNLLGDCIAALKTKVPKSSIRAASAQIKEMLDFTLKYSPSSKLKVIGQVLN